jgi:hypothetical protein
VRPSQSGLLTKGTFLQGEVGLHGEILEGVPLVRTRVILAALRLAKRDSEFRVRGICL